MSIKKTLSFLLFGILYFIVAALCVHYIIFEIIQLFGLPIATQGLFSFSIYCTKMPVHRTTGINVSLFLVHYGYWCLSIILWITGVVIHLLVRAKFRAGKAAYWVVTLLTNIPLLYAVLYLAVWILDGRFNAFLTLLSIGAIAFSLYYYFYRLEKPDRKYVALISIPAFICTWLCWMYLH